MIDPPTQHLKSLSPALLTAPELLVQVPNPRPSILIEMSTFMVERTSTGADVEAAALVHTTH